MIFNMTGGGGVAGAGLNFKVVGGTTQPTSPSENTIWVNTSTAITSWSFGANEPNVCQVTVPDAGDPWVLSIPHTLHEGDILNFTIPATVSSTFEAIRMYDGSGKLYYVRENSGAAVTGWSAGTKVGFVISNTSYPIGNWGSDGGSANLYKWGDYYHNEGTVWISTGASSPVTFNALKNNNITVYPISAKQYVSGAWVDKTAKSYQSGEWVDWIIYMYNKGNQYTDLTGGWTTYGDYADIKFNSDHIYLTIKAGYNEQWGMAHTVNKIDVTNINTLYFYIDERTSADVAESTNNSSKYSTVGISTSPNVRTYGWTAYKRIPTGTISTWFEVDVSSYSGEYYVCILNAVNATNATYMKCSQVYGI